MTLEEIRKRQELRRGATHVIHDRNRFIYDQYCDLLDDTESLLDLVERLTVELDDCQTRQTIRAIMAEQVVARATAAEQKVERLSDELKKAQEKPRAEEVTT